MTRHSALRILVGRARRERGPTPSSTRCQHERSLDSGGTQRSSTRNTVRDRLAGAEVPRLVRRRARSTRTDRGYSSWARSRVRRPKEPRSRVAVVLTQTAARLRDPEATLAGRSKTTFANDEPRDEGAREARSEHAAQGAAPDATATPASQIERSGRGPQAPRRGPRRGRRARDRQRRSGNAWWPPVPGHPRYAPGRRARSIVADGARVRAQRVHVAPRGAVAGFRLTGSTRDRPWLRSPCAGST